jgi:hypothetical protein
VYVYKHDPSSKKTSTRTDLGDGDDVGGHDVLHGVQVEALLRVGVVREEGEALELDEVVVQ